jgi:hypothetical protein
MVTSVSRSLNSAISSASECPPVPKLSRKLDIVGHLQARRSARESWYSTEMSCVSPCVSTDSCLRKRRKRVGCPSMSFIQGRGERVGEVARLGVADHRNHCLFNPLLCQFSFPDIKIKLPSLCEVGSCNEFGSPAGVLDAPVMDSKSYPLRGNAHSW